MLVEISEELNVHVQSPGWSWTSHMTIPVHLGINSQTMFDAGTVLILKSGLADPLCHTEVVALVRFMSVESIGTREIEPQTSESYDADQRTPLGPQDVGKILAVEPAPRGADDGPAWANFTWETRRIGAHSRCGQLLRCIAHKCPGPCRAT